MSDWFCYGCDENIGDKEYCPYCGMHRSGETPMKVRETRSMLTSGSNKKGAVLYPFSREERLATGLYPKDEGYKMSLISKILGKHR